MKGKLFILLTAFILIVFPLSGYDFGGIIENSTILSYTDAASVSQADKLSLWFGAELGEEIDIYIEGSYTFSLQRYFFFNLDSIELSFDVLPQLGYSIGRILFSDFTGHVLRHTADGILINHNLPAAAITGYLAYTGLLFVPGSSIVMSAADFGDAEDVFASPRMIGGVNIYFPDLWHRQSLDMAFLFQKDLREGIDVIPEGEVDQVPASGAAGGRLDTQYFGLGLSGPIAASLYYDTFAYLGTGRTLSYVSDAASPTGSSYRYKPIFSFLGGGGIRYYREQALFTTIGLRGLFSSGDKDYTSFIEGNSAGSATTFVPITSPVFALVYSPRIGNIFLFELNYSIKPFYRRDSTDLQTQLKVMTFFRPTTGAGIEGWIDPASNSLYLGTEVDGAVNFRPLSDLGLSLSTGVFIPGSASLEDTPVAFSGRFELSFSF